MSPHPTHPTMTVYRSYYIYLSLSDPCFSICWNPLAPTFCPHPLIRSHFLVLLVVCWWWWKEEERSGIETERRERARNQQKHTHTTSTMCVGHGKGTSPSSNRYCIILCVYMCLRPKSLSDSWMENQNQLLFPSPPSSSSSRRCRQPRWCSRQSPGRSRPWRMKCRNDPSRRTKIRPAMVHKSYFFNKRLGSKAPVSNLG